MKPPEGWNGAPERIEPMTGDQARQYLGWRYDPPYEFYNTPAHAFRESLDEVLGDNGMDYFSVLDGAGSLLGIYEYSFPGGVMEIGLGLRPDLTGGGRGRAFTEGCAAFGRERYGYHGPVTLKVADFNARAIRLYRSLGFRETGRESSSSYGVPVTFVHMRLG